MAAVLDQITIGTLALYPDLNRELLSKRSPALRMLQENAVRKGGSPIKVTVRYKRNNGGSYSGYDRFNTDEVEQLAQGELQWKNYYVNVTVSEDTLVENAGMNIRDLINLKDLRALPAGQRETVFNIFGEAMRNAMSDMENLLATALYASSPGSKDMESFYTIISTTQSYAGISVSELGTFDYTGLVSGTNDNIWAGKVDENSGTNRSLDLDMLQRILDDVSVGADGPRWAFCGRDAYRALSALLENMKVRQNPEASEIGFRNNIEWIDYGVTFFRDEYADPNAIYIINPDHLKLYIHPALDFVFSGFKEPTDQAAITGQLKVKLQLVCDDRAKQGLLADVAP